MRQARKEGEGSVTRAYIRLDPAFDERKDHYPDGAYRALVACLCMAESQVARGRFRNLDYLKRLLGKRGRWVGYLMDNGDLVALEDGRVYVDGWDEWQEGDVTVGERMQRLRKRRQRNGSYGAGYGSPLSTRESKTVSGGRGVAIAVSRDSGLPAAVSDDETRGHLDNLASSLAPGILPKRNGTPPITDEELVERYQAIVADDAEPDWKREAAREQLKLMRVAS
jgi:hypothetical protein